MFFFVMEDLSVDCEVGNEFLNPRLSSKFQWTTTIHYLYRGPDYRSCQGMSRRVQALCHKAGCRDR
jgi:hypothetical protein